MKTESILITKGARQMKEGQGPEIVGCPALSCFAGKHFTAHTHRYWLLLTIYLLSIAIARGKLWNVLDHVHLFVHVHVWH